MSRDLRARREPRSPRPKSTRCPRLPRGPPPSRARPSGARARYEKLGYSTYRQVIGYYSNEEDAFDMRKACSRDPEKKSCIPLPNPVYPDELD